MSETKNEGNILKVISLGLNDRVYKEMRKPGFSAERLSRELKIENINISAHSIRKFINKTKGAQQELIAKDIRLSNEIMKTAMDYNKELKSILNEVQEVKNDAKIEKDFTTYNQLIGRLLQGIELFAKLTGDIKPKGNVDIKIIYNQINNEIEENMQDVRKTLFNNMKIIDIDSDIAKEDKEISDKLRKDEQ